MTGALAFIGNVQIHDDGIVVVDTEHGHWAKATLTAEQRCDLALHLVAGLGETATFLSAYQSIERLRRSVVCSFPLGEAS